MKPRPKEMSTPPFRQRFDFGAGADEEGAVVADFELAAAFDFQRVVVLRGVALELGDLFHGWHFAGHAGCRSAAPEDGSAGDRQQFEDRLGAGLAGLLTRRDDALD